MRVLGAVVGTQSLLVRTPEAKFAKSRPVGSEFTGDNNSWDKALATQKFTEKAQCGRLVALGLNKNFQNLALTINGTPHIHLLSRERDHHFIEMPAGISFRPDDP